MIIGRRYSARESEKERVTIIISRPLFTRIERERQRKRQRDGERERERKMENKINFTTFMAIKPIQSERFLREIF